VLLGALLGVCILLLAANLWRLSQPPRPDPRIVGLAVRATVYAIPTSTPRVIEVTRVVEVTVLPPTPTATLTPTFTPQPTVAASAPELESDADAAVEVFASSIAAPVAEIAAASNGDMEDSAPMAAAQAEPPGQQDVAPMPVSPVQASCPAASDRQYTTVPVAGGGLQHPDGLHADLNLSLRGYTPTDAPADLINKDGPVDADPPQLAGIFADFRRPPFGQAYRVNDWEWNCGEHGCPLGPLDHVQATLLALTVNPAEALGIPHRGAQVYGGSYKALVLYAEPTRITLGFTREDSVANGYAVHLENVCVDPNLLALYQGSNAAGRGFLPALREDEVLGTANGTVLVAVRDRGVFFDPRSRLDWWQGF
jgi:hypothetical protein